MLSTKPYDLCIVGSGVAGSLIAAVAAQRGLSVIVLEAGSRFDFNKRLDQLRRHQILGTKLWPWDRQDRDAFVDSSLESIGYSYNLNASRVKAIGGSTLHWGGQAIRLRESDFNSASLYGHGIDWPINYADIEPYYSLAEQELGVAGTVNATDPPRSKPYPMPAFPRGYDDLPWEPVAEKLGISLDFVSHARNSQPYQGRSPCVAYSWCRICPSGAKYSADVHVDRALKLPNYTLLDETVARRIVVNGDGQVQEIHASGLDGKSYEIRASQFVIAAHAVETARLLLLSNVGNHSDQVGRNLMEHWFAAGGGYHQDRSFPRRIGFTTLSSTHFYDGQERKDRGAIYLEFGDFRDPLYNHQNLSGQALADHDCESFGHWTGIDAEVEQQPNPLSRVTLDTVKKDLFGDPVPHVNFALGEFDRKTHERAHEIIASLLEARGVKEYRRTANFGRAHHHMGTCRMSNDPDSGVVDKDCRVHGINNLYLAGSSVFPTSGARQPTLTIAALALRIADHLSGKI